MKRFARTGIVIFDLTMINLNFQIFKRDLEKDIKSETRGDFEKLLVALLQGQRDELEKPDKAAAKASAEELYKAGAKACFHHILSKTILL